MKKMNLELIPGYYEWNYWLNDKFVRCRYNLSDYIYEMMDEAGRGPEPQRPYTWQEFFESELDFWRFRSWEDEDDYEDDYEYDYEDEDEDEVYNEDREEYYDALEEIRGEILLNPDILKQALARIIWECFDVDVMNLEEERTAA